MVVISKSYTTQEQIHFATVDQPSTIQKDLQTAFQTHPYDEEVVQLLEKYVTELIEQRQQDIQASLHLLQLYKVYPTKANVAVITKVLIKALMSLSEKQFRAIVCLVPSNCRENETIQQIIQAADLLEAAKFVEFWDKAFTFGKDIPLFADCIRAFIVNTISMSHASIEVNLLKKLLNIDDKEMNAVALSEDWKVEGSQVELPPNGDNHIRTKKFKESIEFSQIMDVVNVLSR